MDQAFVMNLEQIIGQIAYVELVRMSRK